jgi:hypothetical protein
MPKPAGVRKPRFSLSAICHIYVPKTRQLSSVPTSGGSDLWMSPTNLSKHPRVQSCLLEELDRHLARYDAHIIGIGLSKELPVCPLLLRGEVEVGPP